ncbi:MAG: PilT/PilU family type 4a pilus ATPase [Kiritimatiellae bacterium]|nr:PilT/PilU family type 4a pilus ATPase [Kiritimatiellia bacterium]
MNLLTESLFAACETRGASDIHLTTGFPPRFRIRGELVELDGFKPFGVKEVDSVAMDLGLVTLPLGSPDGTERIRRTLLKEGSIDGAVTSPQGSRYRFNLYREQDRHAVALRRLDGEFRSFEALGLPGRLEDFCDEHDGLVVVTGPTGSGKSTTLATMINRINKTRFGHIITIEDPIEYVHSSLRCLVNQRQVGRDTQSFNTALVEALRQDPDVILIGEVRDLETVRTALRAAETGHLVFATLHSGDAPGAIERLVSMFPPEEQAGARRQLSLVLRGVFAQHLMQDPGGKTRHPAFELLVNTLAAANLIATGRTAQLYSVLETGASQGMCTLDQSLADLVKARKIDMRPALALSRNPDLLRARLSSV